MAESFDVYTDQFIVTITPFGANLSFEVREAHPSATAPPTSVRLGTVRMSVEHLKTMVMIIWRQIRTVEAETGVKFEVATNLLNQLRIAPEDWDDFWKRATGT